MVIAVLVVTFTVVTMFLYGWARSIDEELGKVFAVAWIVATVVTTLLCGCCLLC